MQIPDTFREKMKALLGDEYSAWEESFQKKVHNGLRVNRLKADPEELKSRIPFLSEPVPWIDNGFSYDVEKEDHAAPSKHPYYYAGLYYLQEPSAMTPADRLGARPGELVLDLCAAPGGKATELGARLAGEGVLVANDISTSRARALLKNLELQGIGNIYVTGEDPAKLAGIWQETFDRVLIDAPCSGEGMFRREPQMMQFWEERPPESYIPVQRSLILQGAEMVKPGGYLLYSTCTFDREEDEGTIRYLLTEREDMELCEIAPYEGFHEGYADADMPELAKCVRIFPHRMDGEGHFLALLRKKEQTPGARDNGKNKASKRPGKREVPEAAGEFLSEIRRDFDSSRFYIAGEQLYYLPQGLPVHPGVRYLRTGLLLGSIAKNRFEPSQALAMNLRKEEYPRCIDLELSDSRTVKYLKGETLDVSDLAQPKAKGWHLVCVDGYPLGWGKLSGGILKNKYYAGWRWQ